MIAAGNGVVFNPHPGAIATSNCAVDLVNRACLAAGGPEVLVASVVKPTMDSAAVMEKDPAIRMLVCTGGPGVVRAVLSSGKKAIGAGAGNPPVIVDDTADIRKAAKDVYKRQSLHGFVSKLRKGSAQIAKRLCLLAIGDVADLDALLRNVNLHGLIELIKWEGVGDQLLDRDIHFTALLQERNRGEVVLSGVVPGADQIDLLVACLLYTSYFCPFAAGAPGQVPSATLE